MMIYDSAKATFGMKKSTDKSTDPCIKGVFDQGRCATRFSSLSAMYSLHHTDECYNLVTSKKLLPGTCSMSTTCIAARTKQELENEIRKWKVPLVTYGLRLYIRT